MPLNLYSNLITDYFCVDQILMDQHLNSDPYESLKPNRFSRSFLHLQEHVVTPLLADRRIRVWHYTRLLDYEVMEMRNKFVPSTLIRLRHRLNILVEKNILTQNEADIVFSHSPFHSQEKIRSGRLWTTTTPISMLDHGIKDLLIYWGGESAYFRLTNNTIAEKLRNIGVPRIAEIETSLRDKLNAFSVSETILQSWAKYLGQSVSVRGTDLAITNCLESAKVLEIHTLGDGIFEAVARSYPDGCNIFLGN